MEAQRELGMGGQTLGGLGDKHIGRTSMNSPGPLRTGSSLQKRGRVPHLHTTQQTAKPRWCCVFSVHLCLLVTLGASLNPAVAIFYALHTGSVAHL